MEQLHGKRLTGHASRSMQQYKQISTTTAQSVNFYAFVPVNGDATLTSLTNIDGTSATDYNESGTYYDGILYTGQFSGIAVLTGEVLLYLGEQ